MRTQALGELSGDFDPLESHRPFCPYVMNPGTEDGVPATTVPSWECVLGGHGFWKPLVGRDLDQRGAMTAIGVGMLRKQGVEGERRLCKATTDGEAALRRV